MAVQLEGEITIGAVDYSDEIGEFVIELTRTTVTEMATYGDASENDKAGPQRASVTITCKNDLAADTLARALHTAILTDTAELAFTARYSDAAVGADNPEFSGNLVVTSVQLGTRVGDEKVQTQTFPANSVTMAVA